MVLEFHVGLFMTEIYEEKIFLEKRPKMVKIGQNILKNTVLSLSFIENVLK